MAGSMDRDDHALVGTEARSAHYKDHAVAWAAAHGGRTEHRVRLTRGPNRLHASRGQGWLAAEERMASRLRRPDGAVSQGMGAQATQ
jgi:hypothetical protein